MKVERITAIPLDKDTAKKYSAAIAKEQFGQTVKKSNISEAVRSGVLSESDSRTERKS